MFEMVARYVASSFSSFLYAAMWLLIIHRGQSHADQIALCIYSNTARWKANKGNYVIASVV